ncbi:hypothetical protein [Streptomyces sp. NPDC005859]|uniref:hypothetical protein n=1 Tax=Streptomyces sp. NPDC005859 TaxID=3157170 RepID=UPI0033C7DDCB
MSGMPTSEGQLPLEENRRIFREQIAPVFLDGCTPQRAPVVVINGGRLHLDSLREQDRSLAGINPARVAPQYADPYIRQAVLAAVSRTVSVDALDIRRARTETPDTWYTDLTKRAAALRPQLHEWLAGRPADPSLSELLDSFVRRSDKDQWTTGPKTVSAERRAGPFNSSADRLPRADQVPGRAPQPSPPPAPRPGRVR